MKRRVLALSLGGILLAATAATAIVLLGPPRVDLTRNASDVDHVTLYQNGLAFIELTRRFESRGGESLLALPLPAGARMDSVQIEGPGVTLHELRSPETGDASLREGDQLVVHSQDGAVFRGTFVGREEGSLVLVTEAGLALVSEPSILAIEIEGRPASGRSAGTFEVLARAQAAPGEHEVHISYLASGPGWTPHYALDADTGAFTFYATLTGLDDWRNVTLDLVSGSPNVVLSPRPLQMRSYEAAVELAVAPADEVGASVPLGELHRYRYARPLEVSSGETVRLLVEAGELEIVRDAHVATVSAGFDGLASEGTPVQAVERLEFRNTLGEPLPAGRVAVEREGTWIGEDILPATSRGERGNVTLATSLDVSARLVLEGSSSLEDRDTFGYALHVFNRKDAAIDLRAVITYPTYRATLLNATPAPDESLGGRVVWNALLAAGGETTFRIRYEVART